MKNARRIFVQIPSYRDPQLIPTILDMCRQAESPYDLRIVVCWQHACDEGLEDFILHGFTHESTDADGGREVHCFHLMGAVVELIDIPFQQAEGAGWARSVAQERFAEEAYNLQIDAHHRFAKSWDVRLVSMLEGLKNNATKPLLTGYPPSFVPEMYPAERQEQAAVMLLDSFDPLGITRFRAVTIPIGDDHGAPWRARFMSGGFVFSEGSFVNEVRQDPGHFFSTEEIVMTVRAYTHGYDFFHPNYPVLWHYYEKPSPAVWDDLTDEMKEAGRIAKTAGERMSSSLSRALALLGLSADADPPSVERYGLGKERTLFQYERFAGLSFSKRAVHKSAAVRSEPCIGHASLGVSDWERDLVCRRTMSVEVSLRAKGAVTVHAVDVMLICQAPQREMLLKKLSCAEIAELVTTSKVTLTHDVLLPPSSFPLTIVVNSVTDREDAANMFSVSADEVSASRREPV